MEYVVVEKLRESSVPAEKPSEAWYGTLVHLGPIAIIVAILAFVGMSVENVLLVSFVIGFVGIGMALWSSKKNPLVELPPLTRKDFILAFSWEVIGKGFVIGFVMLVAGHYFLSMVSPYSDTSAVWYKLLALVAVVDLWYYSLHRWVMHRKGGKRVVKQLKKEHAVHHSTEDMDFWRGSKGSVLDNGVVSFALPTAFFAVLLGIDLAGTMLVYMILMIIQVTHHANSSFHIGWLRYIIMDCHAHKLHHCKRGNLVNFAAVFSIWDRLLGTYYEDYSQCPGYLHAKKIKLPIAPKSK